MTNIIKSLDNNQNELVVKSNEIFKEIYGTAMRPITISSVIRGETIEIVDKNINIDTAEYDDELFDKKLEFCSKKLYDYQIKAIKKILQLEKDGYNINNHTDDKLVSNGWLLSLPIGSGKSLVFQFISIFYRNVPTHPIIISTDGSNIPETDVMQWKYYPFYYEQCGYIENNNKTKQNAVIVFENYTQRKTTVILTHTHLLEQMRIYFETDFPKIFKPPKISICYPVDIKTIEVNDYDIIVTPATEQNVATLVQLSYIQPFMRIIIDDYTSMPGIDTFRQILASSVIFVSGSGFERKFEDIPASYFTLKYMDVPQLSIVGNPKDTLKGILRNNIDTLELIGNHCEFSQYEFVMQCDEIVKSRYKSTPFDLYKPIAVHKKLHNYLSLMFILKYFDRIKFALKHVENDIKQKTLDESRVTHYLKWKNTIDLNGLLYKSLTLNDAMTNNQGSPLVQHKCMVCSKMYTEHYGYGVLAMCCGAFYCSNCLKSMNTHVICDKETNIEIIDKEHYYCCCCREKDPKYCLNCNRKKDTNVFAYNLINDYFDTSDLKNHITFDYYFKMMNEGFTSLYHEGKPLNIHNDIIHGNVDSNLQEVPILEKILPKDQLGIIALSSINKILHDLNIQPQQHSTILFYGCPRYMVNRVQNYFNDIVKTNSKQTSIELYNPYKHKHELLQPITFMQLDFKESVASLIGSHKNIIAIIQWVTPNKDDELAQLVGRMFRINSFGNKLTFYIKLNSIGFE